MSWKSNLARAGSTLALLALPACGHVSPASGGVAGFRQPVLLGPVDRIGMSKALPAQKVAEYEATSKAGFASSTSTYGNYEYTTTTTIDDQSEPYVNAITACAGKGPQTDIRLTMVKARSIGWPTGISNKVVLEGDVVQVGGAK